MANNNIIGIIGTLLGVVLGGLITFLITYFQFRSQERQNKERRKLEVYEQLHEYLTFVEHEAGNLYIEIVTMVRKGSPPDKQERGSLPWQKLEMLSDFYAAEVSDDIKVIRKHVEALGRIFAHAIYEKYDIYNGPASLLVQVDKIDNQIGEQTKIAKNKLVAFVSKITE